MVTLRDIALATGLSVATVSYALRGDSRVTAETTRRVLCASRRLGYEGNFSARALSVGRSHIISVAVHDLMLPFSAELAARVSQAALERGYVAVVRQTKTEPSLERSVVAGEPGLFADGTILCPGTLQAHAIRRASTRPLVLFDGNPRFPVYDMVVTPGLAGGFDAVSHLVDVGCRRIGVIGAAYRPLVKAAHAFDMTSQRVAGCLKALRRAGVEADGSRFVGTGNWYADAAAAAVRERIEAGWDFDGVFCMTDTVALATIGELQRHGIRVPQDVKVVGFDGIGIGLEQYPTLTSVRIDFDDAASKLVDLLVERIEHDNEEHSPVVLTARHTLVPGESTGSGAAGVRRRSAG